MKFYKFLGLIVSFITNPVLRLLLKNSTRSYLLYVVDGEVLVIRAILSINLKHEWLMPGGGIRKNEDPASALVRELNEELDLKIKPKDLVRLNKEPRRSQWHFNYYVFAFRNPRKMPIKPNKIEVIDTEWIKLDKIDDYPCSKELKNAIKML